MGRKGEVRKEEGRDGRERGGESREGEGGARGRKLTGGKGSKMCIFLIFLLAIRWPVTI